VPTIGLRDCVTDTRGEEALRRGASRCESVARAGARLRVEEDIGKGAGTRFGTNGSMCWLGWGKSGENRSRMVHVALCCRFFWWF